MSITDELRRNIKGAEQLYGRECQRLTAIADHIDAEHEEAMQREHEKVYDMGYAEGMGMANAKDAQAEYLRGKNDGYDEGWDVGFASADDWLAQHESDMAEHGWYRVLDADKVPVRIGDVMAYMDNTKPMQVVALVPPAVFLTEDGPRYADMCRHYHKPTVEDVLTEFGIDWEHESDCEDRAALLKEYAAKLRLVNDEE